jgi:hypothetical protein
MKKLLLVGACLVATVGVMAQGKALFGNRMSGIVDAKVISELGVPADNNYAAEAWVGPTGGTLAAVPGSQSVFRSGAGAGYIPTITITLAQPQGAVVDAQMRAWKGAASLGWAAGGPIRGESAGRITTTLAVDPTPTGALLPGMASFTLVPEPSTIALAVLGAAALLLRRRK